ncbi:MAG: hypothetical protein HY819_24345 [Acidobacteria bacterium]|nr:hypothetical protein [Acidobacteriota bacterium]
MKVKITNNNITVEFESREELDLEYQKNISSGGLSLPITSSLPLFSSLEVVLKLDGGGQTKIKASVVALLANSLALAIEGDYNNIYSILTTPSQTPNQGFSETVIAKDDNAWERVRALSRTEKLLLAPKADRSERAILSQENDPQLILYLLKNPKIGTEEVARIAKSPLINASIAELIIKTSQWANNPEIKIALVNNPRTPTPLSLRILPSLPEPEIRQIAKGNAINQSLKQAALRLIINKS